MIDFYLTKKFNLIFMGKFTFFKMYDQVALEETGKDITVLPEQYQKLKQKNWQGKKCVPLLGYLKLD